MAKHYRTAKDCLNCGKEVNEKFCSHCGQENLVPRETFKHIMSHFITDYLHLDEKLFGSLKPLILKPGVLTNSYNAGQRNKYVNPLRLYIFISIVYFLLNFNIDPEEKMIVGGNSKETQIKKEDSLRKVNIAKLSAMPIKSKSQQKELANELNIVKEKIRKKDSLRLADLNDTNAYISNIDSTELQYVTRQKLLPESKRHGYIQHFFNVKTFRATDLKEHLAEKVNEAIEHNIPKLMFLMLPLYALLLTLFFKKENKYYVEHFFHSIHLHSFIFLLLTVSLLIKNIFPVAETWIALAGFLTICYYIFKSYITVYQESAGMTFVKLIFSVSIYIFFLGIGIGMIFFISFLFL